MRIRRFTEATSAAALASVRAALGPDAMILDTLEADGRVTVTAAADDAPLTGPAAAEPLAGAGSRDRELVEEVRQLLAAVRELVHERGRRRDAVAPEVRRLHRALVAQGVDGIIAAALVRETATRLPAHPDLDAALADVLAVPGPAGAPRVRLFVGPPGDGKTTTIAKLAARQQAAGRRVALVTADTYRVGAVAEMETFGRALGLPILAAGNAADLAAALAETRTAEVVLVDTAGAAPGQSEQLAELAALVRAAGPGAGRTLVVSAACGPRAAERAWRGFASLAPDGCVLTKLDVAPGGPVLAMLWRRGVPVSHVACGRRIPDDLEPATPARLARCLLAA